MTVRIGIVGCGRIAQLHVQGFKAAPELAEVVACCDEWSLDLAQAMAAQFPSARVYSRWQDLVAQADVDVVDICMPHDLHAPITLAAAAAGKHIFVEKPMALNLAEARAMVAAAEAAGVTLMVGQNQRFMADHQAIKALLDRNAIGRIVAVRFDCNQFVSKMYAPGSWMFSRARTGGGMVISTAVHKLDLLRYFCGEIARVSSFQANTGLNYTEPNPNEDVAAILLEFANGIIGEGFYLFAAHKVPIPTTTSELTILYGEKGVIHNVLGWQIYSTEIPQYSGGLTQLPMHTEPYVNSVVTEMRHFLECLRDGREPLTSGRDNLGTMAVVEALYQAAQQRTVVDVVHG